MGTRQGSRCVHRLLDHVPSAWPEVVLGQEVEEGDRWGAATAEGSPTTSLPASPWLCSSSSSQLSAPSSADGCPAVPSSAWRGWACVWNELEKGQIWGGRGLWRLRGLSNRTDLCLTGWRGRREAGGGCPHRPPWGLEALPLPLSMAWPRRGWSPPNPHPWRLIPSLASGGGKVALSPSLY